MEFIQVSKSYCWQVAPQQRLLPLLICNSKVMRRSYTKSKQCLSFTTTLTLAMFKDGYNVAYVPITVHPRTTGKSSVRVADGFNTLLLIIRIIALFDPLKVFLPASALLFFQQVEQNAVFLIDKITEDVNVLPISIRIDPDRINLHGRDDV